MSRGTVPWVKSTYSSQDGGNCVEWAPSHALAHGVVPVRDSKAPDGPALTIAPPAWACFVAALDDPGPANR
ncbi:DUF397 domain-containing protein [Streptomyces sp. SID4919]|uniref:DUF397 domain-containing protein n=1 Tax=unclassified Streptomyces TaxID=2593676 RepID=UPI000823CF34|nr:MULTISPECIES: DUF397 domain-containing protein [unclassified Streptomyces]MYY11932.1 DUF397 domain-containing protein [Streptomyces sp. SID4919]SCK13232.1 protein of unknown function [Streptomyces sp. AmelKG-E11A]